MDSSVFKLVTNSSNFVSKDYFHLELDIVHIKLVENFADLIGCISNHFDSEEYECAI